MFDRQLNKIDGMIGDTKTITQLLIHQELERLKADPRPKSLLPFGMKAFSQNDEDGIIREIFNRIGTKTKTFVEIGTGQTENNTLALLYDDWSGLWIDAEILESRFPKLKIITAFVTKANINNILTKNMITPDKEIDLLSIDIDGNDYHIFDAILCIKPRVVCIEYNAKLIPPIKWCMEYNENYRWNGRDQFGVSLKFLELNLVKKKYRLVACNITGVNAFFVRSDLVINKFLKPFTAENHYQPARYYLSGYLSGHPTN
ncbi:MAG: hypothetical protein ABR936_05710 [Bacteroidota bacterium]|jgi:hypothetical protein